MPRRAAPPPARRGAASGTVDLAGLMQMLANAMTDGAPASFFEPVIDSLAAAGVAAELIAGLLATATGPERGGALEAAYTLILVRVLDRLRIGANGGDVAAARQIEAVHAAVDGIAARDGVAPEALLLLGQTLARAGLDPGAPLQQALAGSVESRPVDPAEQAGLLATNLSAMAAALDHDPFAIHEDFSATAASLPPDQRAAIVLAAAASAEPAMREAALGMALDLPEAPAVFEVLATAPSASAAHLERLARLRPWLEEGLRPALDAALRALRPRAEAARPAPRIEIRSVLACLADGAGATSLFVLLRRGREHRLASILIKEEHGVADALLTDAMTAAALRAMRGRIIAEIDVAEVPLGYLEARLAAALGENLARRVPLPFRLLQVAESLALGPVTPARVTPAALAAGLLEGLPPDRTGAAALAVAHRRLPLIRPATQESWFEAGGAVEALLRPIRLRQKRLQAVLDSLLPPRRDRWAERLAWGAAMLKEAEGEDDQDWVALALVARDLAAGAPLAAMPLMQAIAARTVSAFTARR
jgi:hypothetical protein